jgi:hypothetical protein
VNVTQIIRLHGPDVIAKATTQDEAEDCRE